MKLIALTTLSVFVAASSTQATGLFSAQLPGRNVPATLTIPVRDPALFAQARTQLAKVNVNLSNRTTLVIKFQLPAHLVTTKGEMKFEGVIKNNYADMIGPSGSMVCRVFEDDVLCRFHTHPRQANLIVLQRTLRSQKLPETRVKNHVDIARFFNADPRGYIRFNRSAAGLRYLRSILKTK